MGKVIKMLQPEVYHIKAMVPYHSEYDFEIDESISPYRVIALLANTPLIELGPIVLGAFDFDYDHLFGFYDNFKRHYNSKISYEHPEMIKQAEEDGWGFSGSPDKQVFNMEDYRAQDIFTRKGKKWLMLFDYGDEWHFRLSLSDREKFDPKKKYPFITESKHEAPEQYPDYDDE